MVSPELPGNYPAFPVASTEGAARIIWTNWNPRNLPNTVADLRTRLDQDLQYRILFRDILG